MIRLALAADEAYFPGLAMAVMSAALTSCPQSEARVHVLDGGIEQASFALLEARLAQWRPRWELQRHAIDLSRFAGFKPHFGSVMSYARLLLPGIEPGPRVLYLDADVLVLRDIEKLCTLDMQGLPAAAAQDKVLRTVGYPLKEHYEDFDMDPEDPYYNSGVLLIDLDAWRRERVHERALELVGSGRDLYCHDQCAFNILMYRRILPLDPGWNTFFHCQSDDAPDWEKVSIVHYVNKTKPWQDYDERAGSQFFYAVAEHAGIDFPKSERFLRTRRAQRLKRRLRPVMPSLYRARALVATCRGRREAAAMDRHIAHCWTKENYYASDDPVREFALRLA